MRAWLHILVVLAVHLTLSDAASAASRSPRICSDQSSIIQLNEISGGGGSGGTGMQPTTDGGLGGTGYGTTLPPGGSGGVGTQANGGEGGGDGGIGGTGIQASSGSGIGGTGNTTSIPPGGMGGNGIEASNSNGGVGGTGHSTVIPPGGIGGTGITAGMIMNSSGTVVVTTPARETYTLGIGDAICVGDLISTDFSSQAKIEFTDGAILYALKNTEVKIEAYQYSNDGGTNNLSHISVIQGDIRSVSGAISKTNPAQYAIKTPVATISVIGTDFIVSHLTNNEEELDKGTYTKVISGEVTVNSVSSKVRLRAGESSHVMMNGTQIILYSNGGTCSP